MIQAFAGTMPPPALLRSIGRGEAAGVILFAPNVAGGPAATRALVRRLQAIPRPPGLRAPLLVMIDQEGGLVKRLPGPPAPRPPSWARPGPPPRGRPGGRRGAA